MLRKLFALFFILASLTVQARTAFACEMMQQAVLDHCCCGDEAMAAAQAGEGEFCCERITLVAADDRADPGKAAGSKLGFDLDQLPLLAAAASPPALDRRTSASAPPLLEDYAARSGTLTYLHTLRLRI